MIKLNFHESQEDELVAESLQNENNCESSTSEFNGKISEERKSNLASKQELKGSKLDDKKHTVCLVCGKSFVLRSSYILHRRLYAHSKLS